MAPVRPAVEEPRVPVREAPEERELPPTLRVLELLPPMPVLRPVVLVAPVRLW